MFKIDGACRNETSAVHVKPGKIWPKYSQTLHSEPLLHLL